MEQNNGARLAARKDNARPSTRELVDQAVKSTDIGPVPAHVTKQLARIERMRVAHNLLR